MSHGCCYIAWGGSEHKKTSFEILIGKGIWSRCHGGRIPDNALKGDFFNYVVTLTDNKFTKIQLVNLKMAKLCTLVGLSTLAQLPLGKFSRRIKLATFRLMEKNWDSRTLRFSFTKTENILKL